MVSRVRDYVVPRVEFEDIVCRLEVAGAELKRVAAFEIVAWIVRAMRRKLFKRL